MEEEEEEEDDCDNGAWRGERGAQGAVIRLRFNLVFLCAADSQMSTSTLPTSSQGPVVAMAATTRRDPFIALGPMKGSCCTPTRACAGPMEICL